MSDYQEWIDELRHELQGVMDNIDTNLRYHADRDMAADHIETVAIVYDVSKILFQELSKIYMELE